MQSRTTAAFRDRLAAAPAAIQAKAQGAYRLWADNPGHPSLRFKKVHATLPVYAVRIDLDWRAVGILEEGVMIRFWMGPHSDYDRLLSNL